MAREMSTRTLCVGELVSQIDVGVFVVGWLLGWLLFWRERPLPAAV